MRISSAITLHGTRPAMIGAPVTGVRARRRRTLNSGANAECRCWPPRLAKLPVRIHSSFSRYEHSVVFGACWMPRSSKIATLAGRARCAATAARISSSSTPQRCA